MPDPGSSGQRGTSGDAAPAELSFSLLGPLEVRCGEHVRTPSAPMQRAVMGLLLLHANEVLPTSRIIDVLWQGRPPRSVAAVLQMYITGVRRALGAQHDVVLRTMPAGYALHVAPEQLDWVRFRALAERGRGERAAGRCARAAELFRRALALWRGPALADLDWAHAFEPYAVRLEEERVALVQERINVDLCQGRGIEVVAELSELCVRYPLVESLHQLLMLALDQTGRRVDALRVYMRIRQTMIDEVGIEPGPGLQAAQRAILRDRGTLAAFGHSQQAAGRSEVRVCDPRIFAGWE